MISVIIPVFNTADYIDECVQSVADQTETDLEIILIDDCSTDGSVEKMRRWEQADPRVRVITKERNSGVSDSRNIGLSAAKGEYIAFADSDDRVEQDAFRKMLSLIVSADAQVCIGGYRRTEPDKTEIRVLEKPTGTVVGCKEALEDCFPGRGKFTNAVVWGKLFRRDALMENDRFIAFDEKFAFGEDSIWLMQVLTRCSRIVLYNEVTYNYRVVRAGNTRVALRSRGDLERAKNNLEANVRMLSMAGEIDSAALRNNLLWYVIESQRIAIETACRVRKKEAYDRLRKDYVGRLMQWLRRDHSAGGFIWACKKLCQLVITRMRAG